jgi:hypothetical protein
MENRGVVLMMTWLTVEVITGYIALGLYLGKTMIEFTCGQRILSWASRQASGAKSI